MVYPTNTEKNSGNNPTKREIGLRFIENWALFVQ